MQCEICGATLPEGATTCPECGAAVAGASEAVPAVTKPGPRRRTWLIVVLAILALTVVGVGGFVIYAQLTSQAGPDGAALRMMQAFGEYDAEGILANATHSSLTATDEAAFAQQAVDAKKENGGLPAVKDIEVTKVTIASEDATTATVQLTAKWLTDAATKKYTERDEILTVIKEDGKWLVRLFQ